MQRAPAPKKSLFGGMAGAMGGEKAKRIAELSQGLSQIGIPVSKHRPLAHALAASAERHYPELKETFEQAIGT
jgi:hypothetical protein